MHLKSITTASLAMVFAGASLPARGQNPPPVVPVNGREAPTSFVPGRSGFQKVSFEYGKGTLTFEIPSEMKETLVLKRARHSKWWKDAVRERDFVVFSAVYENNQKLNDILKGFLTKPALLVQRKELSYPEGQGGKNPKSGITTRQISFFAPTEEFLGSLPANFAEVLGPVADTKAGAAPRVGLPPKRAGAAAVFDNLIVGSCACRMVQGVLVPEGEKVRGFFIAATLDVTPVALTPRPGAKDAQLAQMGLIVESLRDDFATSAKTFFEAVAASR